MTEVTRMEGMQGAMNITQKEGDVRLVGDCSSCVFS